jgi:hypothetical protein
LNELNSFSDCSFFFRSSLFVFSVLFTPYYLLWFFSPA